MDLAVKLFSYQEMPNILEGTFADLTGEALGMNWSTLKSKSTTIFGIFLDKNCLPFICRNTPMIGFPHFQHTWGLGGPVGAGPEDCFVIGADMDLKPGGPGAVADAGAGAVLGKEEVLGWKPLAVMLCFTSQ